MGNFADHRTVFYYRIEKVTLETHGSLVLFIFQWQCH